MTRPPTFSVCIPNYNYGRYLGRTIASVLAQSYPSFEIIVADNASTDDSVEVVRSFSDPRIRLVENRRNVGFSANLDRATRPAKNDFLILLSSDDLMRPDALRTYAETLARQGDDAHRTVLTSAVDIIGPDDELRAVGWRPPGAMFYRRSPPPAVARVQFEGLPLEHTGGLAALGQGLLKNDTPAWFAATCYPRRLYDDVEGYSSGCKIRPDSDFLMKLLALNPTLLYVPQRLFAYREHGDNQIIKESRCGALLFQHDAYMRTIEFPEEDLERAGLTRDELVRTFVDRALIRRGLQAAAAGHTKKAFRCFALGMATYPRHTLEDPKAYLLLALCAMGPVSIEPARRLYAWYQEVRSDQVSKNFSYE